MGPAPTTSLLFLQLLQPLVLGSSTLPEGLTLLTRSSCICPGRQLVYECTVVGQTIQYTVWKGTGALDCGSGISLRHGLYIDTGYANGTCNNGAAFARITNNTGGCYTSQLTVNASLGFNGESIQCYFDDGSRETLVNTSTIRVLSGSGSFPPPSDVRVVDVQPGRITFNWTSVDTECDSLSYNIISHNCGTCPPTTSNTSVTCTNVEALGQLCTFLVQTVVCGNTGIISHPTTVMLKAPRVQMVHSIPRYDYATGSLLSIASSFDALEPLTISDGFMNDVLSYNISHFDLSTTNICSQSTAIPVSACSNGLCKHLLHVPSSHCNPSTTNITVTVTTMSLLGTRTSDPVTIASRNQLFGVDTVFKPNTLRISCSFQNPTLANNKRSCTVLFGLDQDSSCGSDQSLRNEHTVRANRSYISVDLPTTLFPTESASETICFVVIASDGAYTTEVKGMLTITAGCDASQLSDGTELSGVNCDSPLLPAGVKDGLVCYTGTNIGATATYNCFNCGSRSHAVRTCLPNGTWNGTVPQCNCEPQSQHTATSGGSIIHTAIPMGIVIILISSALIIVIILLVKSRLKVQTLLMERKAKEKMQIYEDIDISQIIDSMKNVAYETPSQMQIHRSHS